MIKKTLSLILAISFLTSQATYGFAKEVDYRPAQSTPTAQIPAELGKVTDSFKGAKEGFVFYIQDAHLNVGAQTHIAQLIEHLKNSQGVTLVGTEGNVGYYPHSEFLSFPFPEIKQKVFDELLKNKEITGSEYIAYLKGDGLKFYGVDEGKLYLDNIRTYIESLGWREEYLKNIKILQTNVQNVKAVLFNKTLKSFDVRLQDLWGKQKNYQDYLKFLFQAAEKQRVTLTQYPVLQDFKAFMSGHSKALELLDMKGLTDETEALVREVKNSYYQTQDERLLDQLTERLDLLEKFFKLEMVPEQFAIYQQDPKSYQLDGIQTQLLSLAKKARVSFRPLEKTSLDAPAALKSLAKFYELAHKRDKALVEHQLKIMKSSKIKKGVLIAGGFHSAGILEELKKKGVSYCVIQPQLDADLETAELYEGLMRSYAPLFRSTPIAAHTVNPLSNVTALKTAQVDTTPLVHDFWRDKIYTPYIHAVQAENRKMDGIVRVARGSVLGEIRVPLLFGSIIRSGLEIGRLNWELSNAGIRVVQDPAYLEASEMIDAKALGQAKSVKVMLTFLTNHIHEGKVFEPLGIETLAGYMDQVFSEETKKGDVNVSLMHNQIETVEQMIEKIRREKPQIVGLSLWYNTLEKAEQIYDEIQKMPKDERPILILGNILSTFNRGLLLERFPKALLGIGRGELTMEALIRHVRDKDNFRLQSVPNILYKDPVTEAEQTTAVEYLRFDQMGKPRREFADISIAQGNNVNMQTSQGCDGSCVFCARRGAGTVKAMDVIIDEIKELSDKGARNINIVDDVFLLGRQDLMKEFAKRVIAEKEAGRISKEVTFYTTLRVRDVYQDPDKRGKTPEESQKIDQENMEKREMLKRLKIAGIATFNVGIESGSAAQLKRYGKGATVEENKQALIILKNVGIDVEAGFIPFDPEVTLGEIRENIDFLEKTGLLYDISYPFQQMRIQAGTPLVGIVGRSGLMHNQENDPKGYYDMNWLVHNYHYRNPQIASILWHAKQWEQQSVFRFFYAFKQLMRAMPIKGSSAEEHTLLQGLYREIHEIQVHLLKGLLDAEEGGRDHKSHPDKARRDALDKINRDRLRKYYLKFLNYIQQGKIQADKDIFRRLICMALVRNVVFYEMNPRDFFNLGDLIVKIAMPTSMKVEETGEMLKLQWSKEEYHDLQAALEKLVDQGDLAKGEKPQSYRITAKFSDLRDMLMVDLPKKGASPDVPSVYKPSRGKAFNVALIGLPASGKATAGLEIERLYGIPRISLREIAREASGRPDLAEPVVMTPGKMKYLVEKKLDSMDLSRGFIFEGSSEISALDREVFAPRGIHFDYVLFLEPDKSQREKYLKKLLLDNATVQRRLEAEEQMKTSGKWKKDLEADYDYFYQQEDVITVKVPLTGQAPEAAKAVIEALSFNYPYILDPSRVLTPKNYESKDPAKLEILNDLLEGTHEGVKKAFASYKAKYLNSSPSETVVPGPKDHPDARIPNSILEIIMINANLAPAEDRIPWLQFIYGVEPIRLGLKYGWLPGFSVFLDQAVLEAIGTHQIERVRSILNTRMAPDWPLELLFFQTELNQEAEKRAKGGDPVRASGTIEQFRSYLIKMASDRLSNIKALHVLQNSASGETVGFYQPFNRAVPNREANEGVFMFKPGTTMTFETMQAVIDRLSYFGYRVISAKRVDGPDMRRTGIIHDQYGITSIAAHIGKPYFTESDLDSLYKTYDIHHEGKSLFERYFGVPVRGMKIYGAYQLMEDFGLSEAEVTHLWSAGYDPATAPRTSRRPHKKQLEGVNGRVLVVEDDPLVLGWLTATFTANKMEVVQARTAQEALALTREHATKDPFDIIYTDIQLPDRDINGLRLAEEFRKPDHPHPLIPIILSSGYSFDEGLLDSYSANSQELDFIPKPARTSVVFEKMKHMLPPEFQVYSSQGKSAPAVEEPPLTADEALKKNLKAGRSAIFDKGLIDGINKVGRCLYVLPVKDPRVDGGRPFFLVNGHFPHIAAMYENDEAATYMFVVQSYSEPSTQKPINISWKRMREEFLGSTDPELAAPGTVRHDLWTKVLPLAKGSVDYTRNGAHISESALEGLKEVMLWFSEVKVADGKNERNLKLGDTVLGAALMSKEYTEEEINYFLSNPLVRINGQDHYLFSLTSTMDAVHTVQFLLENFPPYIKKSRWPSVDFEEFQELRLRYDRKQLSVAGGVVSKERLSQFDPSKDPGRLVDVTKQPADQRERNYKKGVQLLEEKKIARIIVAAGTGGRFFGYDKPEAERVRAIAPLVKLEGEPRTGFKVQTMVNASLQKKLGLSEPLPIYWMISDQHFDRIRNYLERHPDENPKSFYISTGIPRFNPNRGDIETKFPQAAPNDIARMIYENGGEGGLFKWGPQEFSTKTPGHMDVIDQLILSGELIGMLNDHIEMIDIADASNLGTLPDPELYGSADAILTDTTRKIGMVPVMAERQGDESAGGLVLLDRKLQIVEKSRLPKDTDLSMVRYIFTFRSFVKPEALLDFYGINKDDYMNKRISKRELAKKIAQVHSKLPVYIAVKEVPNPNLRVRQQRVAAQIERAYGDLAAEIPSVFLVIDREGRKTISGFLPCKENSDEQKNQVPAEVIIKTVMNLSPEHHPLISASSLGALQQARSQSTDGKAQRALAKLVSEAKSSNHTTLYVPDEKTLQSFDVELFKDILKNQENQLSLYLPQELYDKVPGKWKRKNLHLVNAGKIALRDHLADSALRYHQTALVAPQGILKDSDLLGFQGYRLVSDRWLGTNGTVGEVSSKSLVSFLGSVSYGLLTQGDLFRKNHLEGKVAYHAKTKTYYVAKDFAFGELLENWLSIFRTLLETQKAA